MADAQEAEEKRKKELLRGQRQFAEKNWYPNREIFQHSGWDPGQYLASRMWGHDQITSVPPMCFTDHGSRYGLYPRECLQIVSIKIASITGGLRWPIDVFGMVTARDVLENRKRNIIYARARSNCQTITEENPYLVLTGPTRAVAARYDPGNIEIVLKIKGATESDDRDLSFLVLTLKERYYCSFSRDYSSKLSMLKLEFHHIEPAVEAIISVRPIGGSSLLPGGFQGVFTASTATIDDLEVVLLAFGEGKLAIAEDGTINLSRRVVSVGYNRWDQEEDHLKVSIVAQSIENEQNVTRDDIVFSPNPYGRSCGVFNVGACKMQVTVAWSKFNR
ncbi:unnamed protein product [Alopecurus aequalis]